MLIQNTVQVNLFPSTSTLKLINELYSSQYVGLGIQFSSNRLKRKQIEKENNKQTD